MVMGEWEFDGGTSYGDEVIVLDECAIIRATRMCCPEHGLKQVFVLELKGDLQGIKLSAKWELELETGVEIALLFLEGVDK